MSTDEQRNEPDERSPRTGEAPVEHNPADESPAVAQTPAEQGVEEPAEQPAPLESEVAPGTAYPASPSPAVDETHIAMPAHRSDDPFSEVDGGEPDEREAATTAFPTPEEDAALRDERARRFGRPSAEGEATPAAAEEEPTSRMPLAAAGPGAVAGVGAAGAAGAASTSRSGSEGSGGTQTMPATTTTTEGDDDPFSEFDEGPSSRAAAHWWSILISLVFVPVAWYLIADGGERMDFNLTNGGEFNWAGPAELAGGALCLFFVLLAARWSSVGAILTGIIGAAAGIAFIVFNAEAMELVAEYQGTLVQALEQLGQNIVDHLLADARSGRLAIYGLALIMVGVVSHGARRQGRREERRKAAIGA
ncbi:hypothetical protein [Pseudactinotalea terrae]|uniref:hypothetical protein n=1 Tax=Pseudactinotalea terrae TaxID=1743262 RepID=UPI0012E10010|nr:hypothetical protein [Pseudactinotalea terrae]